MAEPKDEGRAEPKDEGKAEPKDEGRFGGHSGTGAANSGAFGGGAGFVVVAFISPVGLNVPDLAVRMLQQGNRCPDRTPSRRSKGFGRMAALAQDQARKRARDQAKLRQAAARATRESKKPNGQEPT